MTPEYDVIIIGGGINGAAIAAAVAARGYRTLVLEQGDFASGTTAASTKLIHGGLRYLATGDAGLVHESLQSRERLLRKRPHLVQPLGFLLPVYRGDPRPAAMVRAGLLLYDLLSPRKVTPWHRSFSTRQLQRIEPAISTDELTAAYRFYDAQVKMPERLTLEYLAEARSSGADLRNYAAVDYIIVDRQRARGVDFHDVLTGKRSSAAARLVINAAGPWVDAVLEATGRSLDRRIGGTRGSHLVLDLERRGPRHAVLLSARSDGRPIFAVPWLDHHILGATDIHDDGDPGAARIHDWEIDYLIDEASRALPGIGIERRNVRYAYSGIRALPHAADGVSPGAVTRRSFVIDHQREGVERLLSIVGGKLTTARVLGREVAEQVRREIGRPRARGIRALPAEPHARASFLPAPAEQHFAQHLRSARARCGRLHRRRLGAGRAAFAAPPRHRRASGVRRGARGGAHRRGCAAAPHGGRPHPRPGPQRRPSRRRNHAEPPEMERRAPRAGCARLFRRAAPPLHGLRPTNRRAPTARAGHPPPRLSGTSRAVYSLKTARLPLAR